MLGAINFKFGLKAIRFKYIESKNTGINHKILIKYILILECKIKKNPNSPKNAKNLTSLSSVVVTSSREANQENEKYINPNAGTTLTVKPFIHKR